MLISWARIGVARHSNIMHGVKKRDMKKRSMGGMGSGLSGVCFGRLFGLGLVEKRANVNDEAPKGITHT